MTMEHEGFLIEEMSDGWHVTDPNGDERTVEDTDDDAVEWVESLLLVLSNEYRYGAPSGYDMRHDR